MVSKISRAHAVVGLLIAALLTSVFPLAAEAQRGEGGGNFCDNLETARTTAVTKLEERKSGASKGGDYESKKAERLGELDTTRGDNDSKRTDKYESLREMATTDSTSAAVEDFIATVESLVEDRRVAVDAAIATFEAGVDALMDERDSAVGTYAVDIASELENIFDDAQDACDDDEQPNVVREQLKTDMKNLREDIAGDSEQYSFKDELEALRTERKSAIDDAVAEFKSAYDAAKAGLRTTLGAE